MGKDQDVRIEWQGWDGQKRICIMNLGTVYG